MTATGPIVEEMMAEVTRFEGGPDRRYFTDRCRRRRALGESGTEDIM